jgi:hypothetical protein
MAQADKASWGHSVWPVIACSVAWLGSSQAVCGEGSSVLVLEDAERFASLLASATPPTERSLQLEYLDKGTPGVSIFMPHRIESAANLARAVAEHPDEYRKAVATCLPVARQMQSDANRLIGRVGAILGEGQVAPVYVVFGAGNSGGTADDRGLVLGLEVICREADSPQAAARILRDFIAHEMTHVYQARVEAHGSEDDLLRQSLIEGFADFVMEQASSGEAASGAERSAYGLAHEPELWRDFQADVASGRPDTEWLYRPVTSRPGQPPDMGYWIGKRICEAYYARAADKAAAMRVLLELRDPEAILAASGYDG